ncbi:hypothetical protein [Histidinibacterium aquaticum]|nr:hypothetical protein [Histidinibacterium aquaticum]
MADGLRKVYGTPGDVPDALQALLNKLAEADQSAERNSRARETAHR